MILFYNKYALLKNRKEAKNIFKNTRIFLDQKMDENILKIQSKKKRHDFEKSEENQWKGHNMLLKLLKLCF